MRPRPNIERLRDEIARLEARNPSRVAAALPFGVAPVDARLPGGGLARGALHEVAGGGADVVHGTAAALFAAGILAWAEGRVLWCLARPDLFAPALAQAGLAPSRVIYVEAGDDAGVLACAEEGLRHGAMSGVVAEVARLGMTASRRLQLAAEEGRTLGLALRRWRRPAEASDFGQPAAARTRWRVTALPSAPLPVPGVGRARWLVELVRTHAGGSADFIVEACDEQGRLALPAELARGPAQAQAGRAAPPPEAPLALVGRDMRRRVVHAVSAAARALGLRPGLSAAQAHALVPDLLSYEAEPREDAAGLTRLAAWAQRRYAPVVAADPPDGLVLDVTGAAHLHGGEAALLADMVARLEAAGIAARAAVAPTWGAAHALARWGGATMLAVDGAEAEAALRPLSIAALRLSPDVVDGLRRLGLDTVGELAAQPRAPLALRFASEPGRRLDQALGRLAEPITPVAVPELVQVGRILAEPISDPEVLARHVWCGFWPRRSAGCWRAGASARAGSTCCSTAWTGGWRRCARAGPSPPAIPATSPGSFASGWSGWTRVSGSSA